ncbi:hypothetical protein BAU07_06205 [Bordetella flabilis]|uniref:Uncharacterized protein n=2 Tax=Bordetella flabilis TaxID=463014 RepID=A0A193G9U5_9BORD|nr:hypothetical protein BAU07_06205 [Bordetella flabilis]
MALSTDLAMALTVFGHDATPESLAKLVAQMQRLEQSAQGLMRTSLPPDEFAALRALSDAASAAQDVLAQRGPGSARARSPDFHLASTTR